MLAAVDPTNPAARRPSGRPAVHSATPRGAVNGLANAYLGVGLDVYGNFSAEPSYRARAAPTPRTSPRRPPGTSSSAGPATNGRLLRAGHHLRRHDRDPVELHAATRAASAVPVQVLINPTASPFTSDTGVTVTSGTYKVVVTPIGRDAGTLTGPLPTVPAALYPSANWLSATGIPKQLAFGFVGSTGSVTDNHEISNVRVLTFNPVPQLAVSTTSYSAATPAPAPRSPTGGRERARRRATSRHRAVTQTVPPASSRPAPTAPAGCVPPPRGEAITCTTTATSFTNGTALPALTVVAIVTGASVRAGPGRSPRAVRRREARPERRDRGGHGADRSQRVAAPRDRSDHRRHGHDHTARPSSPPLRSRSVRPPRSSRHPGHAAAVRGGGHGACFRLSGPSSWRPPARARAGAVTLTVVTRVSRPRRLRLRGRPARRRRPPPPPG